MKGLFSEKRKDVNSDYVRCENCTFSAFSRNDDTVVCEKKGIVMRGNSCRKFRYDPFKRIPNKTSGINTDGLDFSLDGE